MNGRKKVLLWSQILCLYVNSIGCNPILVFPKLERLLSWGFNIFHVLNFVWFKTVMEDRKKYFVRSPVAKQVW